MLADHAHRAAPTAATVEAYRRVRLRSDQAVATAFLLAGRLRELSATNEALLAHSERLQRRIWADRARSLATRGQRPGGDEGLTWFVVHGLIDGRPVRGSWAGGQLRCHPLLEGRARLLVDLEESFVFEDPPRCLAASLEHPPVAIALTLIRACDRPLALDLSWPDALG
jgi:hypothetical protein